MLATLLDRLGGLLPKYFIIGAFLPALIFGFLNGAILYGNAAWFRARSAVLTSATPSVFATAAVLIGIAVVGYLLSCINSYLREVLEGKHLLAGGLLKRMEATQRAHHDRIQRRYQNARNEGARIADAKPRWVDFMSAEAVKGTQARANTYTGTSEAAAQALEILRNLQHQAAAIGSASLADAVVKLGAELAVNNIRVLPPNGVNRLSEDRRELLRLIDYARDVWSALELQDFNNLARFGVGNIAPTALGNIAASMQGYGITRYGINLDTFWSRLQPTLASVNKDFYGSLQDSKTQLDFLIACCWLSAITTAAWLPILILTGGPWWLFLTVALAGPAAAWFCYGLAVESYVVFTELVRTSVDLYRFSLLQALHMPLPAGIRDERAAWTALQRLSTFGRESVDLTYQHGAQGGTQ
jgi:hypothetical protein